ncbi:MAG: 3-deoxy-D-manno-octulosonic acid kinase [Proteobacteria bacterium]|nr:3-deoxy-D-manno-octulosonic acid kinase [Pseudomonadota bacterium]
MKGGLILYDAAQGGKVHEHIFAPAYWRARDAMGDSLGGRGGAWRIETDDVDWVLRFYRRGGLPGKFIDDWYLFTGIESTRAWREWRLLAWMHENDLPVPRPVAARVLQGWLGYRAALVTETVPGDSLTHLVLQNAMTETAWRAVGRCIRRIHDAGVWHADLNAHNILVDAVAADEPHVFVLDFDRGRIRPQDMAWRRANLARLKRSMLKVTNGMPQAKAAESGWQLIESGYRN